jgi:hypothetical protein
VDNFPLSWISETASEQLIPDCKYVMIVNIATTADKGVVKNDLSK